MRKIHVITQKEAVSEEKLKGCSAVVVDVFLATSTIAILLENNYGPIYAVKNSESALELEKELGESAVLLGETKGEPIEGFQYPDPCLIEPAAEKKTAIICSTNGTIAIEKAKKAKELFMSSLVNGHAVAEHLHNQTEPSSIVLICSGNDDRFSMEDFVGAGQIVDHLLSKGEYVLSDASKLARKTYKNSKAEAFLDLLECETASLLRHFNFEKSMELVIQKHEKVEVVPIFKDNKILCELKKTLNKTN